MSGNAFGSTELISIAKLVASSTDPNGSNCYGGSCDVDQVKQIAANDQNNRLTNWQSALDPSCSTQTIKADWYWTAGYNSISSYSVLNGEKGAKGGPTKVVLQTKNGDIDVTSYRLCTAAQVNDGGKQVEWDICALSKSAPEGTYDNVYGATFTFTPGSFNGSCQMNVYELQVHGTPTPGNDLTVGAIVGIIIASLVVVAIATVCIIRHRNISRRKRMGRIVNGGEWNGLLVE
ncbi:UNVERIFIED_CONTAM: hypothetical protein HDU68_007751 [Siphonaria sp. JEL0065]|nr:hypothetical protein HDU68_007751 [Siphonaria sp. JEL0065]